MGLCCILGGGVGLASLFNSQKEIYGPKFSLRLDEYASRVVLFKATVELALFSGGLITRSGSNTWQLMVCSPCAEFIHLF